VKLTLYVHPFSSFSWKALIPLWADDTPFIYRNVDPSEPGAMDELKALWPVGKFPLLVDGDEVIPEATCIIEHLQAHHPGPNVWIPDGADGARVRLLDRIFDLHVQGNMQPTVNHAIWPDGEGLAAARGREALRTVYDWLEANLPEAGATEIIVCDDGSPADDAAGYARVTASIGLPRLRLIRQRRYSGARQSAPCQTQLLPSALPSASTSITVRHCGFPAR